MDILQCCLHICCYKHSCACFLVHVHICTHFHQGLELLGHNVWISSILVNNTKWFCKLPVPIYIPTSNIGVSIFPYPSHIALAGFSILPILVDLCGFDFYAPEEYYYLFISLLAIWIASFEKCLIKSCPLLVIYYFLLICMSSLHILDMSSFLVMQVQKLSFTLLLSFLLT